MLTESRVQFIGSTDYPHEAAALRFAIDELPSVDPYHAYGLFELLDASTGRLYEYDLLLIGYSDLYHVEIKSGPGRYEGDSNDWYRTDEAGVRRWMEPPLRLANRKSKILKSRLAALLRGSHRCPFVHTLVFLSANDLKNDLTSDGQVGVVTQRTFKRAITHHEFPGASNRSYPQGIPRPLLDDIRQALGRLGLKKRNVEASAGSWLLGEIVEEGAGYQDRIARHRDDASKRRRARIYLVPQEERLERRQQLRRAADREWRLLWELREHPGILHAVDQLADAPLGPVVLFDELEGSRQLDSFLRENPDLGFEERLKLVQQIGAALAFCHKKGIVHGALSPQAVLVRRGEDGTLDTRLYDFQLAESDSVSGTHHWTQLAVEQWALYQAPELRRDPTARSPASDLFSLGALATFVFTGRPPAESITEAERRLATQRSLAPEPDGTRLESWLVDLLELATAATVGERADDVDAWLELVRDEHTQRLDELTKPPPPAQLDPILAEPGSELSEGLLVRSLLGEGATARVLEVVRRKGDRAFALKVPKQPDHFARIEAEGEQLRALDHPNIVRLEDILRIHDRPCLLMTLAGTETLFRKLQREGSLPLDYAIRFGEDLLGALRHLESHKAIHRDIKPANLGVGSIDRKAQRLTLFDFSLAGAPLSAVHDGTAVYRDPFLAGRGRWDHAADHWSAAVTLHEMLTGIRPAYGHHAGDELDPNTPLVLAAERFDAAVRDRLVRFFERALARDAERRFDNAESMQRAWSACFADPIFSGAARASSAPAPASGAPFDWSKLALDAPLAALPIDLRAKNALDRAGLVTAGELLDLPDNRLSAIRGIGSATSKDILAARNEWRAARGAAPAVATATFFPGYVGPDHLLRSLNLDPALSLSLENAGLATLRALALAPPTQVAALAARHGAKADDLRAVLVREASGEAETGAPTSLELWVDALFPKGTTKRPAWPRRLFGLEPFGHADVQHPDIEVDVQAVATHFDVTTANVYIALGRWRSDLRAMKALVPLRALMLPLLDEADGAIGLRALAVQVARCVPHAVDAPTEVVIARAAALVRALAESEKPVSDEDPAPALILSRLGGHLVAVASDAHASAVRALGAAADQIAARAVLASPSEAAATLAEVVRDSPLAALSAARLLELGALASRTACVSARQELYPRSLAAGRALELSAPIAGGLGADDIARRVALRYPEAEPLPPRPELDELVRPLGLQWDEASAIYRRAGESALSTRGTKFSLIQRAPTTVSAHRTLDEAALAAAAFEERLQHAVDRRLFRVIAVPFERAAEAATAIATAVGVTPIELDKRLHAAIEALMAKKKVSEDAVVRADREGPSGPTFRNLVKLAHDAGETLRAEFCAAGQPLVLVQPGLLARYRMDGFVRGLVEASRRDEQQAILLLVPAVEANAGPIPAINGEMALPGILREDVLWVPRAYLENRHHAAA